MSGLHMTSVNMSSPIAWRYLKLICSCNLEDSVTSVGSFVVAKISRILQLHVMGVLIFCCCRTKPVLICKDFCNVATAAYFNIIPCLVNVDSIKIFECTQFFFNCDLRWLLSMLLRKEEMVEAYFNDMVKSSTYLRNKT